MEECGGDKIPAQEPGPKPVPKFTGLSSKYNLPNHPIYSQVASGSSSFEDEFERYRKELLSAPETDLVDFWNVSYVDYNSLMKYIQLSQQQEYPRIFPVAMDYLSIQASSVPCEHVFSSTDETDTKKRNRILPLLMEVLQILKFIYKKERLNFSIGMMAPTRKPPKPIPSNDLLANLFTKDSDDTTDQLLCAFGANDTDNKDGQLSMWHLYCNLAKMTFVKYIHISSTEGEKWMKNNNNPPSILFFQFHSHTYTAKTQNKEGVQFADVLLPAESWSGFQ